MDDDNNNNDMTYSFNIPPPPLTPPPIYISHNITTSKPSKKEGVYLRDFKKLDSTIFWSLSYQLNTYDRQQVISDMPEIFSCQSLKHMISLAGPNIRLSHDEMNNIKNYIAKLESIMSQYNEIILVVPSKIENYANCPDDNKELDDILKDQLNSKIYEIVSLIESIGVIKSDLINFIFSLRNKIPISEPPDVTTYPLSGVEWLINPIKIYKSEIPTRMHTINSFSKWCVSTYSQNGNECDNTTKKYINEVLKIFNVINDHNYIDVKLLEKRLTKYMKEYILTIPDEYRFFLY